MPAEPIRERAKNAIADRLFSTIIAGAGYWHTPSIVTRSFLPLDQYINSPSYWPGPIIGIVRARGSTAKFDSTGNMLSSFGIEHELIVDINAYVHGDSTAPADTRLERAWQDIRTCLEADPKLGGIAEGIELYGAEPMETDRGSWEPYGWMRQPWLVRLSEQVLLP